MADSCVIGCLDYMTKGRSNVECHVSNMALALWRLQQQGTFCDTTIVAQNGAVLSAHAVVLAAASDRLCVALHDGWSVNCGIMQYRLDVGDCDVDSLRVVLLYLYTGNSVAFSAANQFPGTSIGIHRVCERFGISMPQLPHLDETCPVTLDDVAQFINSCNSDNELLDSGGSKLVAVPVIAGEMTDCKSTSSLSANETTKQCETGSETMEGIEVDKQHVKNELQVDHSETARSPDTNNVDETKVDRTADTPLQDLVVKESPKKSTKPGLRLRRRCVRYGTGQKAAKHALCCRFCMKPFSSKSLLISHMKSHTCRANACSICHQSFDNALLLQWHMSEHSAANPTPRCSKCAGRFSSDSELSKHVSEMHPSEELTFACDVCNCTFLLALHLQQHKARMHDVVSSSLSKQEVECVKAGDGTAEVVRRFACTVCARTFARRTQLRKHEAVHSGVWPESCQVCGRGFVTKASLAEHAGSAHGADQPHKCEKCGRRFAVASTLERHLRIHESSNTRRAFTCKTCSKTFRCAAYLRNHEEMHVSGTRPFVCDICGKGFIGSSNLTTHRRIHTGERPYACPVCDKRFLQLCAVREHEKIHVGLKQYICDVCGKQFMTYAQLYNHSRIHTGTKSFECETCHKKFYTNGDLVKHARIHADRRPFVCDICGKGFKYSSNLHGHARIHTGARPYVCRTCGKGFTYSSHLSRHEKLHGREKLDTGNNGAGGDISVTVSTPLHPAVPPGYFDKKNFQTSVLTNFSTEPSYDQQLCN